MTQSCPHCRGVYGPFTDEEFKQHFKVGDFITGWSTGKVVQITAIGETRFLFRDNGHERPGTMRTYTQRWRKVAGEGAV